MSGLGPAALDARREDGDVFLLDIRPADEYRDGHIDGSHNLPVYHELREGSTEGLDGGVGSLPEDGEVVVVCRAGIVARRATRHLNEHGHEAVTLTGGYAAWRQYESNSLLYRAASRLYRLWRAVRPS